MASVYSPALSLVEIQMSAAAPGPILIISGTNRPSSNTLKVSNVVLDYYHRVNEKAELLSLEAVPPEIFEPSSYATKPPRMLELQQLVLRAGGLHIVMPEYNGSFPGVLKYFIDMLKFPDSFISKPVAFVGVASGIWGGIRPVEHLSQVFGYRSAHQYPDRVFIPGVAKKFDATGRFTDDAVALRLEKQCIGFAAYVRHIHKLETTP